MHQYNWENPVSKERLELVFLDRNKQYGAYTIRKEYENNILKAFLFSCILGMLIAGLPLIYTYFQSPIIKANTISKEVILQVEDFKEVKKNEAIPPLPPILQTPKPSGSTQQFTTPVIIDSITGKEMPPQEKLLLANAGIKTSKGDSLIVELDIPKTERGNTNNGFFIHVEEMPEFPGGEEAMVRFIGKHLSYPDMARYNNISGTVYLSFIVNKNGEIQNPEIKRGIGGGCEEEALRVLNTMPKWKPGKQNGEPVNVQYLLPLKFSLK